MQRMLYATSFYWYIHSKNVIYEHCFTEINECESSPCGLFGKCIDGPDNFTCVCEDGFNGTFCEIGKWLF